MQQSDERRESHVLAEFGEAVAAFYMDSVCNGEARLSGAAFNAACRCAQAVLRAQQAANAAVRHAAIAESRRAAVQCLYWLSLYPVARAVPYGTPAEPELIRPAARAVAATEELLCDIGTM